MSTIYSEESFEVVVEGEDENKLQDFDVSTTEAEEEADEHPVQPKTDDRLKMKRKRNSNEGSNEEMESVGSHKNIRSDEVVSQKFDGKL